MNQLSKKRETFGMIFAQSKLVFSGKNHLQYGINGCGVFKGGIQNWKGFWLKINLSKEND